MLTDAASAPGSRWFPGRAGVEVAARLAARPDRVAKRGLGPRRRAGEDRRRALGGRAAEGRPPLQGPRLGRATPPSAAWPRATWRRPRRPTASSATRAPRGAPSGARASRWRTCSARWRPRTSRRSTPPSTRRRSTPAGATSSRARASSSATWPRARGSRRWSTAASSRSARTSRSPPGQVVLKTPVFELIQYKPATSRVRARPLLIVPPMINKYYVVDLAPERSMIEYLVAPGPAGVRDVVAQPRRAPRRVGPGHLRAGDPRRARGDREGQRRRQGPGDGPVRGRHRALVRARASRGQGRGATASPGSRSPSACSTPTAPA